MRDGLQREPTVIATDVKIALLNGITEAGFARIEAGSFAHPERVPQFHDLDEVLRQIKRGPGVIYKTTCVNVRAAQRAADAVRDGYGPDEISFPISASPTMNMRNTNRTIEQSRERLREVIDVARAAGLRTTATVAAAFGYSVEGTTSTAAVLELVEYFTTCGVDNIIFGDSDGYAYPNHVRATVGEAVRAFPEQSFICHFHDNRGVGIANIMAALEVGIRKFDSSLGGIGGKPASLGGTDRFDAPSGNVATEDLVFFLEKSGFDTGVDLERIFDLSADMERALGRQLLSRVARSGPPLL